MNFNSLLSFQCEKFLNKLFPVQASLQNEKEASDNLRKKYDEAQECSEERRAKLEEADKKINQLQDSLHR